MVASDRFNFAATRKKEVKQVTADFAQGLFCLAEQIEGAPLSLDQFVSLYLSEDRPDSEKIADRARLARMGVTLKAIECKHDARSWTGLWAKYQRAEHLSDNVCRRANDRICEVLMSLLKMPYPKQLGIDSLNGASADPACAFFHWLDLWRFYEGIFIPWFDLMGRVDNEIDFVDFYFATKTEAGRKSMEFWCDPALWDDLISKSDAEFALYVMQLEERYEKFKQLKPWSPSMLEVVKPMKRLLHKVGRGEEAPRRIALLRQTFRAQAAECAKAEEARRKFVAEIGEAFFYWAGQLDKAEREISAKNGKCQGYLS